MKRSISQSKATDNSIHPDEDEELQMALKLSEENFKKEQTQQWNDLKRSLSNNGSDSQPSKQQQQQQEQTEDKNQRPMTPILIRDEEEDLENSRDPKLDPINDSSSDAREYIDSDDSQFEDIMASLSADKQKTIVFERDSGNEEEEKEEEIQTTTTTSMTKTTSNSNLNKSTSTSSSIPSKQLSKSASISSNSGSFSKSIMSSTELPKMAFQYTYIPKLKNNPKANFCAFKLSEQIEQDCEYAVLTTYELELEWLLKQLPQLARIPCLLVSDKRATQFDVAKSFPKMEIYLPHITEAYGVHHSKFMIFFYATKVRVIVSTGNLISVDFEQKMNAVWKQDFPLKTSNSPHSTNFEDTILDYFSRLHYKAPLRFQEIMGKLQKFDFAASTAILLTSVPGRYSGDKLTKYGHPQLAAALSRCRFPKEFQNCDIVYQYSSVGSLTDKFVLNELRNTFNQGTYTDSLSNPEPSLNNNNNDSGETKPKKQKLENNNNNNEAKVKLVWPTVDFVRNSINGYRAGGSLCFDEKNLKPWMKFYKYESPNSRNIIPPHIKTFTKINEHFRMPWICLTSANLSKAAWGAYEKENSQVHIRHFEMGVLLLPSAFDMTSFLGKWPDPANIDTSSVYAPIPYKLPLKAYEATDQPWVWDKQYLQPDMYGAIWKSN